MMEAEEKEHITEEIKTGKKSGQETAANLLSALFHPFLVPLYAYVLLFSFTYLNQTNYGIFPLRFFFSDGYTTEEGEELSIREIKQLLKEAVDHENKENPYNDDELADILREKGYPIARRTIAKYRQQLHIPTARMRRL